MGRKKGSLNHHKKEKPKKEPKQKGRPKGSLNKQKQKQNQHQIVNINIGSHGGSSKEKKEKKEEQRQQQPTLIFNPSLSIPNYNYSNRLPVNPPSIPQFDAVDILQNLLQPPQPPPPQPITRPIQPQPTQPIPTQPIPTQPNTKDDETVAKLIKEKMDIINKEKIKPHIPTF